MQNGRSLFSRRLMVSMFLKIRIHALLLEAWRL